MKKKLAVFIMIVLMFTLLSGCGTSENSDVGKEYASRYYSSFVENDYVKCISMFHESLIENAGGSDAVLTMFNQMDQSWGNVKEYDIKQTGFYSSGGETDVELSIDVTYDTGKSGTDTMTIWVLKDGTAYITEISTGQPE